MKQRMEGEVREGGSVLLVTLVLMIAFGGLVSASLSMMVSENRKLSRLHLVHQVQLEAHGQMEIAKNVVNASPYDVYMQNQALRAGVSATDNLLPNTEVEVRRVGTSDYYVLRTLATAHGVTKYAESIVRQKSPASSNNLLVLDHPVGVSGSPVGATHSNQEIQFFFPGGNYRDQVTASKGFEFVAGATLENTSFSGPVNSAAAQQDPLKDIDFENLWAEGDLLSVRDNLIAEVELKGDKAEIKLFKPAHTVLADVEKTERVFSHNTTETYIESEPIIEKYTKRKKQWNWKTETITITKKKAVYKWRDATREVKEPILEEKVVSYEDEEPIWKTRTVTKSKEIDVWVPYSSGTGSSGSSGGTVGSGGTAAGYWKKETVTEEVDEDYIDGYKKVTKTRTEMVQVGETVRTETYRERYVDSYKDVVRTRTKKVKDGFEWIEVELERTIGHKSVEKTREVPVYVDKVTTVKEEVEVAEVLERTETVPLNGTVFVQGDVRKLGGKIQGRLSLISAGKVRLTDSLQYVDKEGDPRMLNGTDMTKPYEHNRDYSGTSLLAVMAKNDIVYAKTAPEQMEINASLVSAEGSVKFETIGMSEDGKTLWTETAGEGSILKSMRRLGGIVSRKRPVATFIDENGFIAAGFENGESIMDQNLILSSGNNAPPPFMFESAKPTWIMSTATTGLGVVY